ncbi:hypothetical protein HK097_000957, partial [Rhizophlyctis rosea]
MTPFVDETYRHANEKGYTCAPQCLPCAISQLYYLMDIGNLEEAGPVVEILFGKLFARGKALDAALHHDSGELLNRLIQLYDP